MPTQPPAPGAGDVEITLDGEKFTLTPSLEACMQISRMAGNSLDTAVQRCARLDFEFICEMISLGLGATSPALKKDVQKKVYATGVINVAETCIIFVRTIMNGGVRPGATDEEAGEETARPLAESGSSSESTTAA